MPPSRTERPTCAEGAAAASAASAFDAEIVADLEARFGRAWLLDLFARLRTEIAGRLVAPAAERETLARDAHILVSASGTLGFLALSQACAELGLACRDGLELDAALAGAGQAARRACAAIDGMLADAA